MKLQFFCKVNNGKISQSTSEEIRQFIQSMNGKDIEITLQRKKAKLSDPQRRYYFGCVVPIICQALKDIGHTLNKEECHEFLKMKFNYKSVANEHGDLVGNIPQSITTLGKLEFMEYLDKIIQWSAEILDTQIPAPNEQTELQIN